MTITDQPRQRPLSILAVDDEETICSLYRKVLEEEGFKVTIARSGQEALARVEHDYFDLVILDLVLPDMQGTEVLSRIRGKIEGLPVLIVTAHPSLDSSIAAIQAGGVPEYIIKPFKTEDLKMVIHRAVEKAALTLENKRLLKKLEVANQALTDRIDDLEKFASATSDYEKKIADLEKKLKDLEKKSI